MNSLVIYDSLYGNTEKIAQEIAGNLRSQEEVGILRVSEARQEQLTGLKLLIVGCPTQRLRATDAINNFLSKIPKNGLKGVKVAAFDTRLTMSEIEKTPPLPFFVRLFGYAAERISKSLKKKGAELVVPTEGFFVEGMKGPLKAGELERAAEWAKQIMAR
jgi:flavodoxin